MWEVWAASPADAPGIRSKKKKNGGGADGSLLLGRSSGRPVVLAGRCSCVTWNSQWVVIRHIYFVFVELGESRERMCIDLRTVRGLLRTAFLEVRVFL